MKNTSRLGVLPAAALATAMTTAVLSAAPANAVSFTVKGNQCPTAKCVDLGSAGYTVSGGAITDMDIKNSAKTPGTDNTTSYDPFDDSDKVSSYSITSKKNTPSGASTPITVSNLDGIFEFFWGSVDTYNFISFWKDGAKVDLFSGKDIATSSDVGIMSPNKYGNYNFDAFVSFVGDFDSVKLFNQESGHAPEETLIAFEVAAAVPEPASLIGLATFGLISGSTLLAQKRQQA